MLKTLTLILIENKGFLEGESYQFLTSGESPMKCKKELVILLSISAMINFPFMVSSIVASKGYYLGVVKGTSMHPTLKNGTVIVLSSNIPVKNLTNEILVFSERSILHRCVKDARSHLLFKGDNSEVIENVTRDELRAIFIKIYEGPLDFIWLAFS
jgi:hypothetical protein